MTKIDDGSQLAEHAKPGVSFLFCSLISVVTNIGDLSRQMVLKRNDYLCPSRFLVYFERRAHRDSTCWAAILVPLLQCSSRSLPTPTALFRAFRHLVGSLTESTDPTRPSLRIHATSQPHLRLVLGAHPTHGLLNRTDPSSWSSSTWTMKERNERLFIFVFLGGYHFNIVNWEMLSLENARRMDKSTRALALANFNCCSHTTNI